MYTTRTVQLNKLQKTLTLGLPVRRNIFRVLIGLLCACAALYVFFLASTTVHIAERKATQSDIRLAHSRIADLEAIFFKESNRIDLAYAHELGFVEATNVSFKERNEPADSFAFRVE